MADRLYHYTAAPLILDAKRRYEQGHHKPRGLWLSVGDAWKEWCEGVDFAPYALAHRTEFVFADDADILVIDSQSRVEEFGSLAPRVAAYPEQEKAHQWVDWRRITEEYDGVLFSPYSKAYVYDMEVESYMASWWYLRVDVPSACVWNLSAVRQVQDARVG